MRVKRHTYEELERMVEKLKKESHVLTQTEKTMRESEKLYRFLTENTSDVITRHLPDSTYLYISPACRTLFGYTPEELLGTKAFALIHPEDVERVITIFQEVFKTGELRREQYRHLKKDGQYIWVETVGKVIKNELTGNIEDILCVVRDITERKRIEEVLKASEEKYRTLAENSTDAILMADKERKIVSCNQAVYKLFGYDKDEVEGKSAKIFHPSDESFNAYGELVYPIVNKTGFFRTEWNFMRKDGTVLPVELGTSAIKSSDGSITGFVVVIRDITEHKQAEEESKKYQTLFETSNDAIMMLDRDGKFFDGNKSAFELFGFSSKEDFINTHPSNFSPPTQPDGQDSFSASLEHIETALVKGIDFFAWVHKKADGTLFPAEVKLSRLPLGEGVVVQALVRDITERKQAEELFRSLAANSPVGVYIVQKGKFVYINQQFQRDIGYREDELLGMEAQSLVIPEDRETVRNNAIQMLKEKRIVPYEFRAIDKNGKIKWALESIASIQHQGNQAIIGSYQDITERKRAEEESKKYQTLFETSNDAIMMLDRDGKFFDGNKAAFELFGFTSKEDFIQIPPSELSPPTQPDGKDSFSASLEHIETALVKGSDSFEWVHKKKDRTLFSAEVRLSSLLLGEKTVLQALVRDITERRQAEEEREKLILELRTSLEKVKTLGGLLPICAACKKIRDDKGYWNQIDSYIRDHSEAEFTHGICPECMKKLYPDFEIVE